ncbi:Peptidoglycan O-acetyltransferase [Neolewinella maritima]|uniref:Peptidoglycan O-acetyltransferase n=1 Tax=Neolewinella maritima TaxID=1383882 RepID=A0ABM9AWE2_9BACT|nr:MBOAT family protein [Neolewinella maritima]CAH0998990.1 Peptidoglycan O-acetyltransferase [Neolewinella maritima]
MLFNSLDFCLFLPLVFVLYWYGTRHSLRAQNALIVLASYVFYGWWDWRFLLLILGSTAVDFWVGRRIAASSGGRRRAYLGVSIAVNLGVLIYFKYADFFLASFAEAFTFFGHPFSRQALGVVLPVGISFYTFQTLSYSIDVYRGKLPASNDPLAFAAFVSFFPQLVAGPIERATRLLPQFGRRREFDYDQAVYGGKQILWGLFKKMVVADNCAVVVNEVFADPGAYAGSTLLLGAALFAFQIYGDFSGYSDIAIGTARLFGIRLTRNFAYPYFSRNIGEFWRRWHISLSTWFRDYLYIPLGGSRGTQVRVIRNTFVIFLVSGLWHGANWTFVIWGGLHALYFLPLLLTGRNRKYTGIVAADRKLPSGREALGMLGTFTLVTIGWVFFRADSLGEAWLYLERIASASLFAEPIFPGRRDALVTVGFVLLLLGIEWWGRRRDVPLLQVEGILPRRLWIMFYYAFAVCTLLAAGRSQAFIYFQF